jgi:hypothetical protein
VRSGNSSNSNSSCSENKQNNAKDSSGG